VVADALVALADPTRRRLFELVAERPGAVGQLADQLPVSRPAVSQHLKVLREAGLVREERSGTRHVYRLDTGGLEILRAYFESFWERSLADFKHTLEQSHRTASSTPFTAEEES
jgi:DNA-binding transcriptional ArsR family regulator